MTANECEGCRELRAAVIRLAEAVSVHMREQEAKGDYVAFGPEPSDDVRALADSLRKGTP